MRFPAPCLLFLALLAPGLRAADTYAFDPAHSSVTFRVRHFLAPVPGWFARFSGTVTVDPADFTRNAVDATIELASVNTNAEKRDEHLRTPDFFDVANHPAATFRSTRWVRTGDRSFEVTGELSLHGVTRPVTLGVEYLGQTEGNRGAVLTGWQARAVLNRADFGIGKPERSIGDTVEIEINVEARLQKPAAPKP